jgi:hypothetical protein
MENFRTFFKNGFIISGTLLIGGLLIASIGLYALDIYATSRIDQFLLDYYGPEMYDRFTTSYAGSDIMSGMTATTENDYYGYRGLYGLRVLGWLDTAHVAYGAAKEAISSQKCQKRLICEIKSTPNEDKSWMSSSLSSVYEAVFSSRDQNELFILGHQEFCQELFPGCREMDKYRNMKK